MQLDELKLEFHNKLTIFTDHLISQYEKKIIKSIQTKKYISPSTDTKNNIILRDITVKKYLKNMFTETGM